MIFVKASDTLYMTLNITAKEAKREKYEMLLKQIDSLIVKEIPDSGNISNILGLLKAELNLFWIGLYIKMGDKLGLGSFQGLPACTVISWGKGVCGTSAAEGKTKIVDDVTLFPGYIACHTETASEIVIPGFRNGKVEFVLDVDSASKAAFDETDQYYLEKITATLSQFVN
jgi:L-methionine (R)-S-oxide reductase